MTVKVESAPHHAAKPRSDRGWLTCAGFLWVTTPLPFPALAVFGYTGGKRAIKTVPPPLEEASKTMTKLSANKAATYAGVAKKTLLERLNHKDVSLRLSGEKNARGHWEIDTSELDRVFPKTGGVGEGETVSSPLQETSENSALEVEVAVLREKLNSADSDKGHLMKEIDALRDRAERAERKEDQLQAMLTDQREKTSQTPPRRFFGLLRG